MLLDVHPAHAIMPGSNLSQARIVGRVVDCRGAKWKRVDGVHVLAGCSAPELNAV